MALQKKPPVVTIMGHVDHGKTTMLDYIRKTKLVTKEAGEITQSIGAYQVKVNEEKITFIDTPGHEAFMQMRQRGAMAADIIVLVIAANDGVQPQTKESIKIIKSAGVPFIVAINKIDLPEASVDRIKTQLAEKEVFVEGFGGNVVVVPVSAKTGQGIDQLLEMILLTAEMTGLMADPDSPLEAVVIESKFDKLIGPTAALIVKNGRIKKGDTIWAGEICSKARMLRDGQGKQTDEVLPGDPVSILGFTQLPPVGSLITSCTSQLEEAKQTVEQKVSEKKEEKPKLKIILKTGSTGSLEAVLNSLSENVSVVEKSVGEIKESDILLAKTLGAVIYGFGLNILQSVEKLAEAEKVKIRTYKIIYDLLKDVKTRADKFLQPEIDRKILGKAEILQAFEMKGQKIAGGRVVEGKINKSFPIMIKRGETAISDTRIISLKEQKQDINEVGPGGEFGAIFALKVDFQPGDVVLSYSLENI